MPPKTYPYPTGIKPYQIEQSFLGRVMSQGRGPFDQYLSNIDPEGELPRTQNVLEDIQRGTLQAFHFPTDELYNQAAGSSGYNTSNSQGFYQPASEVGDTARIFMRPEHEGSTLFHEGAHGAVGHDLNDPRTPKLSMWDMFDKQFGGRLPFGAYKTEKGYIKEGFSEGDARSIRDDIYDEDNPAHPNLTQRHFDKNIERPAWDVFPPMLQDSLSANLYPKEPLKQPPQESFWDYLFK